MKENDEIRMTRLWQPPARQANAELMTKSERCGALSPEPRDLANFGCAKVERVVPWHAVAARRRLNALQKTAALPPDACAFVDCTPIVFREADPPWSVRPYPRGRPDAITLVDHCFGLRHLVIPWSFDIRHSSLSREMSVPRHRMVA